MDWESINDLSPANGKLKKWSDGNGAKVQVQAQVALAQPKKGWASCYGPYLLFCDSRCKTVFHLLPFYFSLLPHVTVFYTFHKGTDFTPGPEQDPLGWQACLVWHNFFLHPRNYEMFLSFPPDWHRCSPSSTWCIKMMDHVTMAALRGGVAVDVHFVNISRGSFLLQQDACREWDRRSGLSPPPHSQSLVLFLPACPPPAFFASIFLSTDGREGTEGHGLSCASHVVCLRACAHLAWHHLLLLFVCVTKGLIFADEASAAKCLCARVCGC